MGGPSTFDLDALLGNQKPQGATSGAFDLDTFLATPARGTLRASGPLRAGERPFRVNPDEPVVGEQPPREARPGYYIDADGAERPLAERPLAAVAGAAARGREAMIRGGRALAEKAAAALPNPEDARANAILGNVASAVGTAAGMPPPPVPPEERGAYVSGFAKEALPRAAEQVADPLNLALVAGPLAAARIAGLAKTTEALALARATLSSARTPEEIRFATEAVKRLSDAVRFARGMQTGMEGTNVAVSVPVAASGADTLAEGVQEGDPEKIAAGIGGLAGGVAGTVHGGRSIRDLSRLEIPSRTGIARDVRDVRAGLRGERARNGEKPPTEPVVVPPDEAPPGRGGPNGEPEAPPVVPEGENAPTGQPEGPARGPERRVGGELPPEERRGDRRRSLEDEIRAEYPGLSDEAVAAVATERQKRTVAENERDTDALTGVGSRNAYLREVKDGPKPGWVSQHDVQGVGGINNVHGEPVADAILAATGRALRQAADAHGGRVYRKGGDEFVTHWPDEEAGRAGQAEASRALAEAHVQITDEAGNVLDTWQGVDHYPGDGATFKDASAALYRAKAETRARLRSELGTAYDPKTYVPPRVAGALGQERPAVQGRGVPPGRAGVRGSREGAPGEAAPGPEPGPVAAPEAPPEAAPPTEPPKFGPDETGAVRLDSRERVRIRATGEVGYVEGFKNGQAHVRVGDKVRVLSPADVAMLPPEELRPTTKRAPDYSGSIPAAAPEAPSGPIQKLIAAIKTAKPVRSATEVLRSTELRRRAGNVAKALESGTGREAFQAARREMKGELPTADFEPAGRALTPDDTHALLEQVRTSKDLRVFEKRRAADALENMIDGGRLPQEGELQLLERVFGPEIVDAVMQHKGGRGTRIVLNILNAPKAMKSSIDLSASLRQGLILSARHPLTAKRAFVDQVKALFSEKKSRALEAEIRHRPTAELRDQSGLYLSGINSKAAPLAAREEAFMSTLAEKVPGVRASERAYTTFLNRLRADVFDSYARDLQGAGFEAKTHPEAFKAIANWINVATGRGKLPAMTPNIHALLNATFFSPRFIAARLQLLDPRTYTTLPKPVRMKAAQSLLATAGFVMTTAGLMKLAMGDKAEVEGDPRSTDFGKVVIPAPGGARGAAEAVASGLGVGISTYRGKTHIDLSGGLQPWVRVAAQVITGQRKTEGKGVEPLTGTGITPSRADVLSRFVRGKLAPVPGVAADLLVGKDYQGKAPTVHGEVNQLITPLFINDLVEAYTGGEAGLLDLPFRNAEAESQDATRRLRARRARQGRTGVLPTPAP